MNESLWSACGTANASLFNSAQYNDPVPAILSYLRSQSQAEVAAMSASAELYGTFQVNWRSEVINSEQGTSNADAMHLAAFESDLAWAQKVASARDAYYAELGESTSSFNESFLDALESYNSSMLGAEFARAQGLFSASKDYSLGSYSIESEYARTRFETSAAYSLSMLDAAVAEMVGLADMEAYYARKSADEYAGIGIDENGITRRWDIDTKNSTAMYEKRTLITETKKAADALLNALNQSNTSADDAEYQGSLLTLQAVYDAAIAIAEETYNSAITTALYAADHAIGDAEESYEQSAAGLQNGYEAMLAIIDSGGEVNAEQFLSSVTNNNSGAAVQQGAPQNGNGNQGNDICDHPGCTGHAWFEPNRSWKTWLWAQDHIATYNAQKGGVTKTEEPAPVDLMATDVPLRAGMSVTLGGRNVGAEAEEMLEQLFNSAQTSLSAASFLPVIGEVSDFLNAVFSFSRGNYVDVAAYAAASWIPLVGGAFVKKGADTLGDVTKKADEVADVGKDITGTSIPSKLPTNAGNLKTLSKEWLKEKGIDAHELKRDILGRNADISIYNIAVDENGLIVLVPGKRGSLPNVDTGISISLYLE